MKVLLDTHSLLWFYLGDGRLSGAAKTAILDVKTEKLVSPASFWELAIKISVRKYALKETYGEFIQHAIRDNGFAILAIEPHHAAYLTSLPFHHRDPFDRMLVAQAIVEGIALISGDPGLDAYPIKRLW